MLRDLIAQAFCRAIRHDLRRLGFLGALFGAYFALHVKLPLSVAIATREAQAGIAVVGESVPRSLARLERHAREVHLRVPQRTNHAHSSKPRRATDKARHPNLYSTLTTAGRREA